MAAQRSLFSARELRELAPMAAALGFHDDAAHWLEELGAGTHDAQVVSIHPGQPQAWAVRVSCSCGWSYPNTVWRWAATGVFERHVREVTAAVPDA